MQGSIQAKQAKRIKAVIDSLYNSCYLTSVTRTRVPVLAPPSALT